MASPPKRLGPSKVPNVVAKRSVIRTLYQRSKRKQYKPYPVVSANIDENFDITFQQPLNEIFCELKVV